MMHKIFVSRGWWVRAGIALALALAAIVSQVRPTFAWSWPDRTWPVPVVVTEPADVPAPVDGPVFFNSVNWGG